MYRLVCLWFEFKISATTLTKRLHIGPTNILRSILSGQEICS